MEVWPFWPRGKATGHLQSLSIVCVLWRGNLRWCPLRTVIHFLPSGRFVYILHSYACPLISCYIEWKARQVSVLFRVYKWYRFEQCARGWNCFNVKNTFDDYMVSIGL